MKSIAVKKKPLTADQFDSLICEALNCDNSRTYLSLLANRRGVLTTTGRNEFLRTSKANYQSTVERIIARADETVAQTFRVLGFPPHRFANRVEWEKDFVADVGWDKDYYLNVPLVMWNNDSDLKLPWELSRGHYLVWLAEAWLLTGKTKYIDKLIMLMEDWIASNPYPYGINWTCPMEAAIRMVNWIAAFDIIGRNEKITDEFAQTFYRVIYQHAIYIEENLEVIGEGMNTNHYLANLLGLLAAGTLFRDIPAGKMWLELATVELEKEIQTQTLTDGFCYESSLNYQVLTSEMYLLAYVIASRTDGLSERYRSRLESMFGLINDFLKPDGSLPNLGDGDSGRILIYDAEDRPDASSMLDLGAVMLGLPELRTSSGVPPFNALCLLDPDETLSPEFQALTEDQSASKYYRDAGLVTMKEDDLYLFFGVNPIGSGGVGGHKHNDMLTIEISCGKTNFIVDSGTYTYTSNPEARNRFRSTESHSVPSIKDVEQNRFIPRMLFAIRPDADVRVNRWESNNLYDLVEAEHTAYTRLPEPLMVLRLIYFDKVNRFWVFRDSFNGTGDYDFQNNLILGDVIAETAQDNRITLLSGNDDRTLEIINFSSDWSFETVSHEISPQYGSKRSSSKITFSRRDTAPIDMIWTAIPSRVGQDISERRAAALRVISRLDWNDKGGERKPHKLILKRSP